MMILCGIVIGYTFGCLGVVFTRWFLEWALPEVDTAWSLVGLLPAAVLAVASSTAVCQ